MENMYRSTRDKKNTCKAKEAIVQGIASDGGLYVYDEIDRIELPLEKMMEMDYFQMAEVVLQALLPDFTKEEVKGCVDRAYRNKFDTEEITPLYKSGEDQYLELFHGPTSAFKDVGLSMLPQLMSTALKEKQDKKVMILTATSGDTGKAALEGFKDVERVGITVFYPYQGVSKIQQLQMSTQRGNNVSICAMKGNFDDAQTGVKNIFNDTSFQEEFAKDDVIFSSANSINIGRLIPQIVYYFYAYKKLVERKEIKLGEEVNFCVPTGNFGNILAGYYGKLMGLPVHKFIVASNANNVLYDFFNKGVYDRRRPFHKTFSPSMDILVSSNLERLLYYMSGKDADYIKDIMSQLKEDGQYQVSKDLLAKMQTMFYAGYASDEACAKVIKEKFTKDQYLMDPHTAVGYTVMKNYQKEDHEHICVLLSTASPYKFSGNVYASITNEDVNTMDEFTIMKKLEGISATTAPAPLKELEALPVLHQDVIEKEDMKTFIRKKTKEKLL